MMIENATVIDYQNGIATVKCQSKTSCGHCQAKANCGASVLSELGQLTGKVEEHHFTITSSIPLTPGQKILVGLDEKALIHSVLLVYILPLITLLTTAIITSFFTTNESIIALLTLVMTLLSFLIVHYFDKKLKKQPYYQPKFLKTL
ncbi:hypothetical protein CEP45_05980 [Mergibacter septicus]|uniref:SoxR reducing system RseC family protein n=1 Tax=Mergibacter septicus TaxID=221402 RepID=UPI001C768257|nr:SoxR reducing system RseC family protein [Mergibacter septicus]QDJ13429.1 hypothetical protein CEP45_05980 [Mergibacter septicus]